MKNRKWIDIAIGFVALAMIIYHMFYTQMLIQAPTRHVVSHVGFAFLLVFLNTIKKEENKKIIYMSIVFTFLSFAANLYVHIFADDLELAGWALSNLDVIVGLVIIIMVLEATRQTFGLMMPLLTIAVIFYPFIGQHLSGPFNTIGLPIVQVVSNLSVGLTGGGIYGPAMTISANYIFLFIIFGSILQAVGATKFFMQLGRLVGSKVKGGPGLMAVVSSSAVGSITGSTAANIAITGAFTIPLMKKVGYKSEQAAAIEAAASNGGQVMPPVMGIVAFGMAGLTGIPYLKIISMALIPAILYFLSTGLYVYFWAAKLDLGKTEEKVDIKELLLTAPMFFTPILVIIFLLTKGYTIMNVAFWSILSTIAVSMIRKETRPSFSDIIDGLIKGAGAGAGIAVMCGAIGMLLDILTMSGIGVKLSAGIETWSAGHLPFGLLIVASICILMGMGGTSLSAYIIVSVFAVPALMKIGIGLEQAHFFVVFVTIFAFVTPPVAIGALIASKLASASYVKTAVESTKVAAAGFLLPYMFIFVPVLLLQPQEPLRAVVGIIACIVILLVIQIGFVGFFRARCSVVERVSAFISALCLFIYVFTQDYKLFAVGIVIFILLAIVQILKPRKKSK